MHIEQYFQSNMALGSEVTINIAAAINNEEAESLFNKLWKQIYTFERQFSRFLPSSELSVFNRSAGLKVPISLQFKDILVAAKKMSEETDGLYNPFILPALQRAGYKKSAAPGYEDDPVDDFSNRSVVTIDRLIIEKNTASIPYGTALDLGGCGKGYLADQLRKQLNNSKILGYWISMGGDVATFGHDGDGNNWTIKIQNAENLKTAGVWSIVCPKSPYGIATSGTFHRKNQTSKIKWHHIVDPLTLKPAKTDIRLATVCANTALEADVLASCAVILGSKKAKAFLKSHGAKAALLQCKSENSKIFNNKFGASLQKKSYLNRANKIYA